MGATIHFTRPDGRPCQGYYASPASRDRAAGIVVQEWWGPEAAPLAWRRTAAFLDTDLA